jgi:hypothetical protein
MPPLAAPNRFLTSSFRVRFKGLPRFTAFIMRNIIHLASFSVLVFTVGRMVTCFKARLVRQSPPLLYAVLEGEPLFLSAG